jgi:hypothetical protein
MPTAPDAQEFAHAWIIAWNSHDLDRILFHYAENIVLTSPAAAKLLNDPAGTVTGIPALRAYFQRGLQAFPNLHFELIDVFAGLSTVVLIFKNQRGARTAEFMEFQEQGKIVRVVANYSN